MSKTRKIRRIVTGSNQVDGAGVKLVRVVGRADISVIQLSIDETQPPIFNYELGKRLASLRGEGVLVIGSGNIVHNLSTYAWGKRA